MNPINPLGGRDSSTRRRGAVAAFTAITMVVLIGFAALTIDVGYMYSVRLDLQNAADAAALSAAAAYASDDQYIAQTAGTEAYPGAVKSLAYDRASSLFDRNVSIGRSSTIIDFDDLVLGRVDVHTAAPIQTGVDPGELNAVYVRTRRDAESSNGPVELFFAQIFGYASTNISASAVAAFDDNVEGIRPAVLIPFTIHRDIYNQQLTSGHDNYGYDADSDSVSDGADDIREIHLFPYENTPGNFGLLNIGGASSSGSEVSTQIEEGITADELETSFGVRELIFTTPEGDIDPYTISGNTGLHSSFQGDIDARMGEVVGIFLHDDFAGKGANTTYNITGIRFVRVMAVNLAGRAKYFIVQPAIYSGEGVILDPDAPSTGGLIGQVVLAR
jgi:hypothetical protein